MGLRDYMLNNYRWKLGALVSALLVWAAIKYAIWAGVPIAAPLGGFATRTLAEQPIRVLSIASDGRRFKIHPARVDVTLQAEPRLLDRLTGKDIRVFVNLSDLGDAPRTLRQVEVHTPAGVTLEKVDPPIVGIEQSNLVE